MLRSDRRGANRALYSEFGGLFLTAQEHAHARMRYASFETHVVEVHEDDFENFVGEVYRANDKY
jgi:hypothetical protein